MSLPQSPEELRGLCVDDVGMRREMLIAALRDQTMWPAGFQFEWGDCNTCAMGLLYATRP